ncbi:hypothetical protein CN116_20610 [Sinorhizobium meliloti]|nr:hypothetical protein CN125_11160 [Sinorhizobium meliloti]RVM45723.1 hypothetical protein CN121_17665 [Sinorhizobium meliloti]RVM64763.1 hypothetical protein CN124_17025 [Sinorhizobium meliloti]RVM74018.1 hypothetical protein CN123_00315 [Sinorhizobium meliloti]RVM85747.1 hypothetical protein CN117_09705 [Sinorhizobium meliloti]
MIIRDPRQHPILCRRGTPGMHANAPEQVDAAIKAAKKPAVGEWAASPVAIAGLSRTRKRISRAPQSPGRVAERFKAPVLKFRIELALVTWG